MSSSFNNTSPSSFVTSYYHPLKDSTTREIKSTSLRRCDDDFLTIVGLYDGFWKTVPEDPEGNFAHSHGGIAKKLFGSGGFSNAIQLSDKGVAKLPRILPGDDQFNERIFYRNLITELRVCLWEPIRDHPNITNLEDIQWFPGPHPSIEENWNYMWPTPEFETAEGTLSGLIRENPGLPLLEKIGLLFDIAKGLDCLHHHGVVHSDIKPDNVFIFPDPQRKYIAKLADFGCSMILKQEDTHGYLSGGTKAWSDPEAEERLSHEDLYKTDLYSFGLVVWYVLTGGHAPFKWLESWCDTACLTSEDISNLKRDGCFLPLSLESLSELSLSEFGMMFATKILGATLCPKETRVRYLVPLFEEYSQALPFERNLKTRPFEVPEPGFLGPIKLVDIRTFLRKASIDDRLRGQIFNSIKDIAASSHNAVEELTPGSVSWQLFLCYYHGFGTPRDHKIAMSTLIQACKAGHTEARGIVVQFHQAHGTEHPPDLPVVEWLEEHVQNNDLGASKTLKSIDPEAYERIRRKMHNTIKSCDGCIFPGGDHNTCDYSQSAEGALAFVQSLLSHYDPESEGLIRDIDRDLGAITGNHIIHFAAATGMEEVVRGLIDNNLCERQAKNKTGLTPLCLAFRNGHRSTALLLLSRMPLYSRETSFTNPIPIFERLCLQDLSAFEPQDALDVAAETIRKVPDAVMLPAPSDGKPCDPMMKAILRNSLESVRVLLELGGRTTLWHINTAAELLSGDILNLLLWDCADKGRQLSVTQLEQVYLIVGTKSDPLDIIQRNGFDHSYTIIRTYETLDYFTRLWCPDLRLRIQQVGLIALCVYRRYDIIQLVLDPLLTDCLFATANDTYPPLWWAMRLGDMECFSLFIDYGAATCDDVTVVFAKSVKVSNPFYVSELIKCGCLLNDRELLEYGDAGLGIKFPQQMTYLTPFETALTFDCFDTAAQLYRDTGRHIGLNWDEFLRLLITGSQHTGLSKIDFLLNFYEKEKLIVLPPCQGGTVLHRIQDFWSVEPEERSSDIRRYIIQVVRRFPQLINTRSCYGGTPIFGAAIHHNTHLVEALIDSGTDLDIKDNEGYTVLDIIMIHRIWEVLRADPSGTTPPREKDRRLKGKMGRLISCNSARLAGSKSWADSDFDRSLRSGPENFLHNTYRGDAYDQRLDKIYSMIKAAGGSSTINGSYSRVTTLDEWTQFWVRRSRDRLSGTLCADEDEFKLMARFVRLWGARWEVELGGGIYMEFVVDEAYCEGVFESCNVGRPDESHPKAAGGKAEDNPGLGDESLGLEIQQS